MLNSLLEIKINNKIPTRFQHEQKAAYKHEQKHILQDDFHTDVCADDLEKERH